MPVSSSLCFSSFAIEFPEFQSFLVKPVAVATAVEAKRGVVEENKLFPKRERALEARFNEFKGC